MMLNVDQVNGMLRIVVPAVCTYLATRGFPAFGDASVIAQITAAVIAVAAVGLSFVSHTNSATLRKAAAISDQIHIEIPEAVIMRDPRVADIVSDATVPNVTMRKKGP